MKIFFSVGEPSGDLHGANLIEHLHQRSPQIQCIGFGGPRMSAAGCDVQEDLTKLAIMGFVRVLKNLGTFRRLIRETGETLERERPDAVVLIDYPGFNWHVAKHAKRLGIPVFYYGVPQMWAWAGWRVKKMRRLVDHVLCKLPFEAKWYQERDCNATFVGHPYYDELAERRLDEDFLSQQRQHQERLIAILPGSRNQEVELNLQWLLKAAQRVHQQVPDTRFVIASFNDTQADMARTMLRDVDLPVQIEVNRTPELIQAAHSCLACSGSVSLELLYHCKPTVIHYWVNKHFMWLARRFLVKVNYITLVNLLADENPFTDRPTGYDPHAPGAERVPFPEYPTHEDRSEQMAAHIVEWLQDDGSYQQRVALLEELKARYAESGASERVAQYILEKLGVPADATAGKAA